MNAPKRWKESDSQASPELRSVLSYAGRRAPDAAYVAALTGAVLAEVAVPGAQPAAVATLKASGAATSSKLLALTLAAALAGAGGSALFFAQQSGAPDENSATPGVQERPAQPAAGEVERPRETASPAPDAPAPAVQEERTSSERRARTRSVRTRSHGHMDELGLLQAARVARRSSEARALGLLREHERSFPDGLLREERDALLIELLSSSEPQQAARRAADFLRRFPHSAYRERVLRLAPDAPESPR